MTIQKEKKTQPSNRAQSKEVKKDVDPQSRCSSQIQVHGGLKPHAMMALYSGALTTVSCFRLTTTFQRHLGVTEIQIRLATIAPMAKNQCKATAFSSSLTSRMIQKEADLLLSNTFPTKNSLFYDSPY